MSDASPAARSASAPERRRRVPHKRDVLKALRLVSDDGEVPAVQRRLRSVLLRVADRRGYLVVKGMYDPWTPIDVPSFMADTTWWVARDGVKHSTAQLLAAEVRERGVPGGVAEVGVCTGDFAALLSRWFPDVPMVLFDTFEGFDARDREKDVSAGLPSEPYTLPPTTPDMVRARLHDPDRADIRAGWFPETATGLDDAVFCFVHVDVGMYAPTLAALQWAWPRLAPGGYLLVADYGNKHAPGARKAVREFTESSEVGVVVLPDFAGTAVLAKGLGAR